MSFNKLSHFTIISGVFIIIACNSAKKENPVLKEAAQTHEQALQLEKQVAPQLAELTQVKNSINVQGRALTPEEQALVQEIEVIERSYGYWEENHVEVPGYAHAHDHDDEAHSHEGHDHGAKLELTPEDMLTVQREFRDSIVAIQRRVDSVLQKAKQIKNE